APNSEARKLRQHPTYPSPASSPTTLRIASETRRPGTFSMSTYRGRSSRTRRAYSNQRPERDPSMPARFPACERSWQGNPPARDRLELFAFDFADVAIAFYSRPVLLEHLDRIFVDLDLPPADQAGPLQP